MAPASSAPRPSSARRSSSPLAATCGASSPRGFLLLRMISSLDRHVRSESFKFGASPRPTPSLQAHATLSERLSKAPGSSPNYIIHPVARQRQGLRADFASRRLALCVAHFRDSPVSHRRCQFQFCCLLAAYSDRSADRNHGRYRGESGHRPNRRKMSLLTHSGHHSQEFVQRKLAFEPHSTVCKSLL